MATTNIVFITPSTKAMRQMQNADSSTLITTQNIAAEHPNSPKNIEEIDRSGDLKKLSRKETCKNSHECAVQEYRSQEPRRDRTKDPELHRCLILEDLQ